MSDVIALHLNLQSKILINLFTILVWIECCTSYSHEGNKCEHLHHITF